MSGRTTWYAEDAAWHRRELIVELGEEFGAGGPMVMKVLRAWAQEQRSSGGGRVRGGFRSLAREAFVTVPDARSVVEHASQIGALDDLEIDDDGRRFTCRVSGWSADQERGRAAFRKEKQRELSRSDDSNRDKSRSVTPTTQPNQTKEEQLPPVSPPQAGDLFPSKPEGNRQRDVAAHERDVAVWAAEHFPDANPRLVASIAGQLRSYGVEPTVDHIREFVADRPMFDQGITGRTVDDQEPAAA